MLMKCALGMRFLKPFYLQAFKLQQELVWMQFIDLVAQQQRIKPVLDERIARVLAHGQYIMGPEIKELETRLAGMAGTGHCITCSSGSTALDLVLMAWGIGPGDAVFTTPPYFYLHCGEHCPHGRHAGFHRHRRGLQS